MVPRDAVIVRRVEAAIVDREAHLVVRITDQPAVPGETGEDREIALGDAERHVGSRGLSPFGDDMPAAHYKAVGAAAGAHRPERLVPWRALLEIAGDHLG